MNYSIRKIAGILDLPLQQEIALNISEVATDSRKIFFPVSTLFFALPGIQKSGEFFIEDLIDVCFFSNLKLFNMYFQ